MSGQLGFQSVYMGPERWSVVPKLAHATDYEFRVTAQNVVGTSKPSARAVFTTEASKPGVMPKPIAHGAAAVTSVTLSFEPPKDDGGADVMGYIVEVRSPTAVLSHVFFFHFNKVEIRFVSVVEFWPQLFDPMFFRVTLQYHQQLSMYVDVRYGVKRT